MQKAGRIALLVAAVLLGVAAVALLGVNLYVQSHGTQARIQNELSQRLGTELRIQRISVTPWWGLKLTGITIPQADPAISEEFLRAETFRLRVRFLSLFSGRLVIKEVALIEPKVIWAQNADGKWRIPGTTEAAPAAAPAPAVAAEPVPATQPPPAIPPASAPADEGDARFTPEVRRVMLTDGSFRFLDGVGRPVATFEGVNFRSSFRNAAELRGDASIAKTSLRNRFFLEQVQTPLRYDSAELDLSQITARAAAGEITGRFHMRPIDPNSPFSVRVKFRDIDADRVVTDAGGPEGMVKGRLEGYLDANGNTADPNALAGTGEIHLRDGEVRKYALLVALGQILQIDELRQLRFEDAYVKYHIEPGVVHVDELLLRSPNIRVAAAGTIGFSGKLRLDSRLAISDMIREQLFRPIRDNFQPGEEEGYTAVAFKVTGTVEKPKTDLMDKLVGGELRDLRGLIGGFLGGDKPDRPKKRKKKDEPADATATPPQDEASPTGEAAADDASAPEPIDEPAPEPAATP